MEYIVVGVTTIHIGGLSDHGHGHGHGHGYDAGAAAATTHNLIGLCTGCLVHGLFSMGRLAELWWLSRDTDAVHTAVFSLKRMATGVVARAVVLVGVITGVGPLRSVGWVLAALALTYFMGMGELLVRAILNKYHISTTGGKKAKGGTSTFVSSSKDIHGKGSEAAETAAAAATPSSSSTAGGSALGAKQVPMHISFFAHRFGEFMMLMVGESVLSLSTTQVAELDVDVYISVVAGYVVTSAMMFLLYVDV